MVGIVEKVEDDEGEKKKAHEGMKADDVDGKGGEKGPKP